MSLLISFAKIMEILINARLTHIEPNNQLVHEQYGSRTHSLTDKAAFTLINNILIALNNKLVVGGIYCDMQKAFPILLCKLKFYGIGMKCKILIGSYLTGRYRRVVLGNRIDSNNSSKWETTKYGVPPGLSLGPLFFLLYINDLLKIINKNNNMVL
jgi:hypothetical protein